MKEPCIKITLLKVLSAHRNAAKLWMKLCWLNSHTSTFCLAFFSLPLLFYSTVFPTGIAYQSWRYTVFSFARLLVFETTTPYVASLWGVWLIRLTNGMWTVCVTNWYWFTLTAVDVHRFKYDGMVFTICEYLLDENWNNLVTVNGCTVFIISTVVFTQMRELWWIVCIKGMWVFRND